MRGIQETRNSVKLMTLPKLRIPEFDQRTETKGIACAHLEISQISLARLVILSPPFAALRRPVASIMQTKASANKRSGKSEPRRPWERAEADR